MVRIPKNGDFLIKDDVAAIYEAYEAHQKKFPLTPPPISLAWVMMNIGNDYAPVECIEQEWEGSIFDVDMRKDEPRCPNGHALRRGAPLRLSWSRKIAESIEDRDDNCDVWVRIDFGHGPVELRCTQTGEHKNHGCSIMFQEDAA